MTIKLSDRHKAVFDNLIPHQDVWDFCCDHGYLGTAAYKSQNFPNVYFVDQVTGIIERLRTLFEKHVFTTEIETHAHFICQSGQDITTPIMGTVCITGVGGLTAFEILQGLSNNNVLKADRLILGPHRDDEKLLSLLEDSLKSFKLQAKIEVLEKTRLRKIYILNKSE